MSATSSEGRPGYIEVSQIDLRTTETELWKEFGRIDDLVGISFQPFSRSDQSKTAIVEFKTTKQAVRALKVLQDITVRGRSLKLCWSKQKPVSQQARVEMIKVIIPDDDTREQIDLLSQWVAEKGYSFEVAVRHDGKSKIMEKIESDDALKNYYRWRTFSLAQGDTLSSWRRVPFQMVENGPLWKPPERVLVVIFNVA